MNSLHTFSASGVSNTFFSFALLGAGRGDVRPSDLLVTGLSVQVTPEQGLLGPLTQRQHLHYLPASSSTLSATLLTPSTTLPATLPGTLPGTLQHPPPSPTTFQHPPPASDCDSTRTRQANVRKNDFTSGEVATMLWSLAVLRVRPDPVLSAAMTERALQGLGELSSEEMGMMIWALGVGC